MRRIGFPCLAVAVFAAALAGLATAQPVMAQTPPPDSVVWPYDGLLAPEQINVSVDNSSQTVVIDGVRARVDLSFVPDHGYIDAKEVASNHQGQANCHNSSLFAGVQPVRFNFSQLNPPQQLYCGSGTYPSASTGHIKRPTKVIFIITATNTDESQSEVIGVVVQHYGPALQSITECVFPSGTATMAKPSSAHPVKRKAPSRAPAKGKTAPKKG